MGRSTVAELITRGMNRNDYNNTGIDSPSKWIDAFNAALQDLAEDIGLQSTTTITFNPSQREYALPDDYFEIMEMYDGFNCLVNKRRLYDYDYSLPQGYYIINKGANYAVDLLEYNSPQTFTVLYLRYPALLALVNVQTQKPEVPTIGEDALIEYAIMIALRNNNQIGQSQVVEERYERLRKKIRDARYRAVMGW